LTVEHSVPVGMDPVAVALFGNEQAYEQANEQAWVVNHLSDSISVVDVTAEPPRVIDTLLVGDEPRDIVFAGADNALAFVTTAHRGQSRDNTVQHGDPSAERYRLRQQYRRPQPYAIRRSRADGVNGQRKPRCQSHQPDQRQRRTDPRSERASRSQSTERHR